MHAYFGSYCLLMLNTPTSLEKTRGGALRQVQGVPESRSVHVAMQCNTQYCCRLQWWMVMVPPRLHSGGINYARITVAGVAICWYVDITPQYCTQPGTLIHCHCYSYVDHGYITIDTLALIHRTHTPGNWCPVINKGVPPSQKPLCIAFLCPDFGQLYIVIYICMES